MNGVSATGNPSSTFSGDTNQFTVKASGEKQTRGVTDMIASPAPRDNIQSPVMYDQQGKTDPINSSRLLNGRFNKVF